MKNRIDKLFETKKENILSIFLTAGYPKQNDTLTIIKELDFSGVDMIEIGIPYSDPLADGPIIQQSSQVALENGVTLKNTFEQLQSLRSITQMPVLLMGYINTVLQFGIEKFYEKCHDVGIDGLILPDLPLEEYNNIHKPLAEKFNIHVVFLISPDTSIERIKLIDKHSNGFIYLVSSNSTTGSGKELPKSLVQKVESIKHLHLKNPLLMGFGIKGKTEFEQACQLVNGAIIGSSFIQLLTNSTHFKKDISQFILIIKN
jgi:tryptophan synthase alpha chain